MFWDPWKKRKIWEFFITNPPSFQKRNHNIDKETNYSLQKRNHNIDEETNYLLQKRNHNVDEETSYSLSQVLAKKSEQSEQLFPFLYIVNLLPGQEINVWPNQAWWWNISRTISQSAGRFFKMITVKLVVKLPSCLLLAHILSGLRGLPRIYSLDSLPLFLVNRNKTNFFISTNCAFMVITTCSALFLL